jgi:hypothetical protein
LVLSAALPTICSPYGSRFGSPKAALALPKEILSGKTYVAVAQESGLSCSAIQIDANAAKNPVLPNSWRERFT